MRCTLAVALLTLVLTGPAAGNRHMSVDSAGSTQNMKVVLPHGLTQDIETKGPYSLNTDEPLDATSAVEMGMALKLSMDGAAGASSEALAMHARKLLGMFTNLSGELDEQIHSTLAQNEPLRQVLSTDLSDVSKRSDSVRASMLERAKAALSHKDSARLESSLSRKDATPCACFAESWNGFPLADLDRSGGYGSCEFSCNDRCKREYKFKFDPEEAQFVGAEGIYQPVTASQCKGGCNCLDATQTVQQVHAAKNFDPSLDIVYTAQIFGSESECLMTCPYSCPDKNGIDWEGLCIDEFSGY